MKCHWPVYLYLAQDISIESDSFVSNAFSSHDRKSVNKFFLRSEKGNTFRQG